VERHCLAKPGRHPCILTLTKPQLLQCLQLPLTTLLVRNEHGHGMPFAFIVTESETADSLEAPLRALWEALQDPSRGGAPGFRPGSAMMDDSRAEQKACR